MRERPAAARPPPEPVTPPDVVAESPTAAAPQAPPPAAAPAPEPKPRPRDVAVLYDAKLVSAVSAAAEIAAALPADRYRVSQIEIGAAAAALEALAAPPAAIVAVGLPAVETARARLPETPIVFTQVFAYEQALAGGGPIWGVQSLPPLTLQLEELASRRPVAAHDRVDRRRVRCGARRRSAPSRQLARHGPARGNVGIGSRDAVSLPPARDRDVDGLWLLPDNDALSPQRAARAT